MTRKQSDNFPIGFILVIGKLSDIMGRRTAFLASTFIFTVFSIACGAAQTMVQLQVTIRFPFTTER
jgi:MFS family permease